MMRRRGGLGVLALSLMVGAPVGLGSRPAAPAESAARQDASARLIEEISANLNDMWSGRVQGYRPPRIAPYEPGSASGCGHGRTAVGTFYCAADSTIYIDLGFWREMQRSLDGSGSGYAGAYVIAHAFGHHVQRLARTVETPEPAERTPAAREFQADCLAGVWAANAEAESRGHIVVAPEDMEKGLAAAVAISRGVAQLRAGSAMPDDFGRTDAAERLRWLRRGLAGRDRSHCDTSAGP